MNICKYMYTHIFICHVEKYDQQFSFQHVKNQHLAMINQQFIGGDLDLPSQAPKKNQKKHTKISAA